MPIAGHRGGSRLSGNAKIQLDLFYSYRTDVPLYPEFQAFFRQYQPPALIVWGKNDFIFRQRLFTLPARPAECGDAFIGYGSLCARDTRGRDRQPNRRIPQAE
jgi:hypothetical protein